MYKFLIADDHPLMREAIRGALSHCFDNVTFLESDSLDSTIAVLRKNRNISIIIFDLTMPGCDNFYGLLRVKELFPSVPMVVLSASDSPEVISQVMAFGADGFIAKTTGTETIKEAIITILKGGKWLSKEAEKAIVNVDTNATDIADKLKTLTPKQFQVLKLVKDGLMNKQIATTLDVTEATVKAHIGVVFKKLDVKTRTQIVLAVEKLQLD
ncbi:response regulator transcription factor [Brumicola nitratireducens]|uniref:Two component LuxR family transcriptional regulator n=1 Tax=Glaciecola nitratireducens (strain JCM 12485 / KCTC 12276 / FR1064) TaxID=1085623 RepID=G4QGR9_GLANF|nr:response regulator transcription factor [Glaciecola nitratireducens]AEP29864.1 two component LuxR family transcriptional regulator [Glaciecola nitratireducens FR1064]